MFSALGVSRVMRSINVRYLLTYLLTFAKQRTVSTYYIYFLSLLIFCKQYALKINMKNSLKTVKSYLVHCRQINLNPNMHYFSHIA